MRVSKKKEKKDLIARKTYYSTSVQLVQLLSTHLDNPRRDLPFSPKPHPRNMWRLLIFSLPLWNALPFYPAALSPPSFLHRVRSIPSIVIDPLSSRIKKKEKKENNSRDSFNRYSLASLPRHRIIITTIFTKLKECFLFPSGRRSTRDTKGRRRQSGR